MALSCGYGQKPLCYFKGEAVKNQIIGSGILSRPHRCRIKHAAALLTDIIIILFCFPCQPLPIFCQYFNMEFRAPFIMLVCASKSRLYISWRIKSPVDWFMGKKGVLWRREAFRITLGSVCFQKLKDRLSNHSAVKRPVQLA